MRDHTYRTPPTARIAYRRATDGDTALARASEELERIAESGGALARETMARAFCGDRLPRTGAPTQQWATAAAEAVSRQAAWPALVAAARGSRRAAATAAAHLSFALAETMTKIVGEKRIEDPTRLDEEAATLDARAAQLPVDSDDRRALEAAANALRGEAADAAALLDAAAASAIDARDANGEMARIVAAAAATSGAVAQAEARARSFGLAGVGATGTDEPDDWTVEAIAHDHDVRAVLDLAGRMLEAMPGGRDGVGAADAGEVVGITTGGDVRRLLPADRGTLAAGGLAAFGVLRALVDESALVYEMEDETPREIGDMVVVVDRSGSMSGPRSVWARAVAMCAIAVARRDARGVVIVSFAGAGDVAVARIDPTGAGASDAMRVAMRRAGGGTDLGGALRAAMAHVATLREPDVLVVTDGDVGEVPASAVDLARADRRSLTCVRIATAVPAPWADAIVDVSTDTMTAAHGARIVEHATR